MHLWPTCAVCNRQVEGMMFQQETPDHYLFIAQCHGHQERVWISQKDWILSSGIRAIRAFVKRVTI